MNELISIEINSKNKQKLIDLLNESNLVVEMLNINQTYVIAGRDPDERVNPQPKVLEPSQETQFNYSISTTT